MAKKNKKRRAAKKRSTGVRSKNLDPIAPPVDETPETLRELLRELEERRKSVRYPWEPIPQLPLWIEPSADHPPADPECGELQRQVSPECMA